MPESTAEEQISDELAKREATYKTWFVDESDVQTLDDDDRKRVRDLAGEHGWVADEAMDDESSEDLTERNTEDAAQWITKLREDENKLDEQVLGFSIKATVYVRLDLSTGGPGDWIDGEYDPSDGKLYEVKYHFAPWFDHAERSLSPDDALYRLLQQFTSPYDGMELSEILGQ